MAEVLVIGKKISEMGLVNEITGEEKIPTSASGDKAVTTGQLLTYVNNNGVAQWGRVGGDITNQVDLQNQFTQERDTLKSYTQEQVSQQQVVLQEHIDSTNEAFEYARDNGSALPYKEGTTYEENAVVVKDGVLQQWKGGVWRSAVAESLSDTVQTFSTPEAGVDPVSGVVEGNYFNVRSTSDESYADEYQNVGGSAVATGKRYLSTLGVQLQEKAANTIVDEGGKNQQELNIAYTGKRWFAPLYGVKSDGVTDDSAALNAIILQMQIGDILEVLPRKHKLSSPLIIDKAILITSQSTRHQTLGALFDCDSHGVVFKSPWIMWDGIGLVGKYTATVLDPSNKVFGSIGMKHEYSADGTSSGVVVRDCFVTYFDTNIVEAQEVGQAWAGAYREYYNVFLRYGRINLAMIDGATLSNWHGGAIQLATEWGIYIDCPNMQYNNLVLHGTALEKSGFISGLFPTDKRHGYGIYVGKSSKLSIHGGYVEDQSCFAENGGTIDFHGGHQHLNSKCFAKDEGVISFYSRNGKASSKVQVNENYATFLNTADANTVISQVSSLNKQCRITSTSSTSLLVSSKSIPIRPLKSETLSAVRLAIKYNVASGFTANPDIIVIPFMRVIATPSGSDGVFTNLTYPLFELAGEFNKDATFEFTWEPRVSSSYLPEGSDLAGLTVFLAVRNLDGTPCDFGSDNLDLVIKNIEVEVFANTALNPTSELPKSGTTANRPTKLGAYERGYTYYDTTENRIYLWNGTAWVKQKSSSDDLFGSYTQAQLSDITNNSNTSYKLTSYFVFNTTNGKMYYRTGTTPMSAWRATDGSGDITPV